MTNSFRKTVVAIILLIFDGASDRLTSGDYDRGYDPSGGIRLGDVCSLPHNIHQREDHVVSEEAADPVKVETDPGEDHLDPISSATTANQNPEHTAQETPTKTREQMTSSDELRQEATQETKAEDVSLRAGLLPSRTTESKQTTSPIGGLPTLPSLPTLPPLPPFPAAGGSAIGPMAVLGGFSALIMPLSGMGNVFSGLPGLLGQLSSLQGLTTLPALGG